MNSRTDAAVGLNCKILVLDDEPLVRLMVCNQLERTGALVNEAATCAEALGLARNTVFDAGVFDHRLPDGDGLALVRRLREEGISFPVVMLSGEAADVKSDVEEDLNICAVLPKPFKLQPAVEALAGAAADVPKNLPDRVGRYVFWNGDPAGAGSEDCLAVDLSGVCAGEVPDPIMEGLRVPRCGTVVVGACGNLRNDLESLGLDIEFAADMDELAALSRRPTAPLERAALLGN